MAKKKKKKKDKKKQKKVESVGIAQSVRRDDAPAYLIQRTARLLRVLFLRIVQSEGSNITPEMWMVLTRLLVRDGQYQNELADATFRDRPNLSRIVVGLEDRSLVTRRSDEGDRRRVRVYLTKAGRTLVHETAPVAIRTRDQLYAGIKDKDLKSFRKVLRKIEANALATMEAFDTGGTVEDATETD
jgi:DNA-binding MarR family transcriptional regulator